ncbi:glycerate dehydrogenase [Penicillium alfredii]|uniref:Glycerate dehydrogenase n=1 Tax=Penicillium alfredii TaxID=1506179 RepID=A0A9W9KH76_9EURO|nr:glycerate dehydrogenase [Penicillium alfredii]KAJ5105373.1 glycerate dehydrogenase [Penicillium alfredii]
MHHKIVALDAWHVPIPADLVQLLNGDTYELKSHHTRPTSTKDIQASVKDATIIAITVSPLDAETLSPECTPNLRLVLAVASGTDPIDKQKCKERGIRVLNSPNANSDSVAEHVLALYFASRRRLLRVHNSVLGSDEWPKRGTLTHLMNSVDGQLPLTCRDEVVGVVGNGAVGQRVAALCRGLGMTVMISSRKGATDASNADGRVSFTEVLARSTVLVLCVPRNPDTVGLLSTAEFAAMSPKTILINVSRGGIVDEIALLQALREGKLSGAATDVFLREPSGAGQHWQEGDSPLLKLDAAEADDLNLVVTPHVAWYTTSTINGYLRAFKQNIEHWCEGKETNIVV